MAGFPKIHIKAADISAAGANKHLRKQVPSASPIQDILQTCRQALTRLWWEYWPAKVPDQLKIHLRQRGPSWKRQKMLPVYKACRAIFQSIHASPAGIFLSTPISPDNQWQNCSSLPGSFRQLLPEWPTLSRCRLRSKQITQPPNWMEQLSLPGNWQGIIPRDCIREVLLPIRILFVQMRT